MKAITKENFGEAFGIGQFTHNGDLVTITRNGSRYAVTVVDSKGVNKAKDNLRRGGVFKYLFGEDMPQAAPRRLRTKSKEVEVEQTPAELYARWEAQQLAKVEALAEVLGEKMAESAAKKVRQQKAAKIKEYEEKLAKRASYKQDLEKASSEEEVARKALISLMKAGDTAGARYAFDEWERKATAKKNAAQKLELL